MAIGDSLHIGKLAFVNIAVEREQQTLRLNELELYIKKMQNGSYVPVFYLRSVLEKQEGQVSRLGTQEGIPESVMLNEGMQLSLHTEVVEERFQALVRVNDREYHSEENLEMEIIPLPPHGTINPEVLSSLGGDGSNVGFQLDGLHYRMGTKQNIIEDGFALDEGEGVPYSDREIRMELQSGLYPWVISIFPGKIAMYNRSRITGDNRYELTNHLGNVLSVVSDKKIPTLAGSSLEYFNADILAYNDYYPFGMLMPKRHANTPSYRYGFNGKEMDDEVMGEGNWQDYGERMYSPRIGRFPSVDPIFRKYPALSPYQFASNTPIWAIDQDGLEAFYTHGTTQGKSGNSFSASAKNELDRISGNTERDESFRWYAPLVNDKTFLRKVAAYKLVNHILKVRERMIKDGDITKDEHISLIGYSHGGNVDMQAARILYKEHGIKVNVITVSTPAYNSLFNTDSDNLIFGDSEDPQGNPGINQHIQVVHENDDVVDIAGGNETYSNPENTKNYIITEEEIPLDGGIESHTELPYHDELDDYLQTIPTMEAAPAPDKK